MLARPLVEANENMSEAEWKRQNEKETFKVKLLTFIFDLFTKKDKKPGLDQKQAAHQEELWLQSFPLFVPSTIVEIVLI